MEKAKTVKLILGLLYLLIISIFLWLFFSKFSLNDFSNYDFIKQNTENLKNLKDNNLLISISFFILFTIIWVLLLGFGSPIFLLGGFIFGKWLGTLIVTISLSIGATLLYLFASYFFKELIEEKFSKKFESLKDKFKKNEFNFFLIYRFVGGIPFAISNILPALFNVKIKNFFFGSLLGMYPQIFVWTSLGSGIEKIIDQNLKQPTFIELIYSREIYLPILGFIIIIFLGVVIKNFFYKN